MKFMCALCKQKEATQNVEMENALMMTILLSVCDDCCEGKESIGVTCAEIVMEKKER